MEMDPRRSRDKLLQRLPDPSRYESTTRMKALLPISLHGSILNARGKPFHNLHFHKFRAKCRVPIPNWEIIRQTSEIPDNPNTTAPPFILLRRGLIPSQFRPSTVTPVFDTHSFTKCEF
jgi:hypothetical protein